MTPRPEGVNVRRATSRDIPRMSAVLAEAFLDDPGQRWLFPDERRRLEQGTRLFEILSGMQMGQQAWTTNGIRAGAVWFAPGSWPIGASAAARRAPALLRLLGRRAPFALIGLARVEARHPAERHWYLANIGTHPAHRRRGLASALLARVLDAADAAGEAAYLEAPTQHAARFFRKRGFEARDKVTLPGGPELTLMWRPPRA